MRLKRLTVHGFKSFADRTSISFEGQGVTAIVGPNGCGKSNVIDAVKWILGEQRPTSLRGKEMQDVIFNGTVRRAPMGLCEGTLVFDNREGVLPSDEEEVAVCRRVYRSGETEYLINGRPARLKDVRDLFAGTGIGHGGYGFMEQGKIDSVLASNPVDRRRVFEEAAGISRFRTRKREAELKLRRVEDNLTRLHDIVEEIARQIRSLKIHAGKARSHREMTVRVRDLQVGLNRHRYAQITGEQEELASSLGDLVEHRNRAEQEREQLRDEVRDVEERLQELMQAVGDARTRQATTTGAIGTLKEKVALHTGYRQELAERLENRTGEIQLLEEKLARVEEDCVVTRRDREAAERDRDRLCQDLERHENAFAGQQERTTALQQEVRDAESELRAAETAVHELAREEARLETDLDHVASRLREAAARAAALEEERTDLQGRLDDRTGSQQDQTSVLEDQRVKLTEAEHEVDRIERDEAALAEQITAGEADLARIQGRLSLLTGILGRQEGLDAGVRALIERHEQEPSFMPGLLGILADQFTVDLQHAPAVEAALGGLSSALVVRSGRDVVEGMRYLAESGTGSALFLPLDRFPQDAPGLPEGILTEDPAARCLLGHVLQGLRVLDADSFAASLETDDPDPTPLVVTPEGATLRDGRIVRLPSQGEEVAGLVVMAAERRELEERQPSVETGLARTRERARALRADRDAARARVKQLSVQLVAEEGEAARIDQEIVRIVGELERRSDEAEALRTAQAERRRREAEGRERAAGLVDRRGVLERESTAHAELLERRRAVFDQETQALAAAGRELEAARIEQSRLVERVGGLEEGLQRLVAAREELQQRLAAARDEVDELTRGQERMATTLEEERAELAVLFQQAENGEEAVREKEAQAADVRERMQDRVAALERVEGGLSESIEELSLARGREGELRAALESLVERTREDLEMELEELRQAPEADGEEVDWKAVEQEIRELRNRIARLGNVNLAAVEELAEAEERAAFLFREQADLEQSRDQLQKVLKDIEKRSTGMFLETFTAVQGHFSNIFRALFGGGKATLTLEDADQPLESGIEIKARPPGKELRSITLLSGGERTMTAVALLFAIFRARPAPCAFLDEVDAALDEDNTERFCTMLDQFIQESQFVIVTHSRRTMERAELLLGVTMPERGVSRPVAVTLEQVAEDGGIETGAGKPDASPFDGPARRTEIAAAARRARPADGTAGAEKAATESP